MVSYSGRGTRTPLPSEVSRRLSAAGLSVDSRQLRPARELGFRPHAAMRARHGAEPCAYDPVDLKGAEPGPAGHARLGQGRRALHQAFIHETKDLIGHARRALHHDRERRPPRREELRGLVRERGGRRLCLRGVGINADGASGLD